MMARSAALFFLVFAPHAAALPSWSWDTLQTYIHCANTTGEWNEGALETLATQPFVVFEKFHKLLASPRNTSAEAKIAESCRRVKDINPGTDCYIYIESDWARTYYDLGRWVAENRDNAALQCGGEFVTTTDVSNRDEQGQVMNFSFYAYDFTNSDMRGKWVARVMDAVASGHVDGAFIDGNRGGFSSGITGACDHDKRNAWASGLRNATEQLARALGPERTLISNYATPEALGLCQGGMMERGGSTDAVAAWGEKRCGLKNGACLLDFHAQYADRSLSSFQTQLAAFLLGAHEHAYFGVGGGWGGRYGSHPGAGPGACASWLRRYPEYAKALGAPKSDSQPRNSTVPGGGTVKVREFGSGTLVVAGQWLAPDFDGRNRSKNPCSVVYWADTTTTSPAPELCPSVAEARRLLAPAAAAAARTGDKTEVRLWPMTPAPNDADAGTDLGPEYATPTDGFGCGAGRNESCFTVGNVSDPTLTPFIVLDTKVPLPAVVVAPGGGYSHLAFTKEGEDVARMFNSLGVHAFVLKYRVPMRAALPGKPWAWAPLQDAQRAVGLVRARDDVSLVGFAGFSAGGHLTAHVSASWHSRIYSRVDATDDLSCRPDFALHIYPWRLLAGKNATQPWALAPEVVPLNERHPPSFFAHALDDETAHPEGSMSLALTIKAAGGLLPTAHLYPSGSHGFGLCQTSGDEGAQVCSWPDAAEAFLRDAMVAT